ncbi:MAG: hypothetical protein LBE95_02325 [Holosporaceae bacterium]|jgi:hypothetical protein|nr:hypothetical protein [Holosporaceae bacterium]
MILETAITIPILICLIFYAIELMKINEAMTAIETIASEATFDFIAHGHKKNFDKIIEKYRPCYVPTGNIRYWFRFYESLSRMCSDSPYGGEDVAWPRYEDGNEHLGLGNSGCEYLPSSEEHVQVNTNTSIRSFSLMKSYIDGREKIPAGTAFVLTFVCDYPFSSAYVKAFFSGGSNTINLASGTKGTKYLLWGRGVGILGDTID